MFYKVFVVVSLAFSLAAAKRQGGLKINNWRTFADDDFCFLNLDHQFFVHENCDQYYECDENNVLHEGWCPDDEPVFDANEFLCGTVDESICWIDIDSSNEPGEDSECPLNTKEVTFIPGEYCDEYYICLNGVPNMFLCREGQHWNEVMNYCDDPHVVGCDPNSIAPEHPTTLPNCQMGFVGTLPHLHNCNWFIYCDNGNRSIQQCRHLYHYDVNQRRCLFMNYATCVKDSNASSSQLKKY